MGLESGGRQSLPLFLSQFLYGLRRLKGCVTHESKAPLCELPVPEHAALIEAAVLLFPVLWFGWRTQRKECNGSLGTAGSELPPYVTYCLQDLQGQGPVASYTDYGGFSYHRSVSKRPLLLHCPLKERGKSTQHPENLSLHTKDTKASSVRRSAACNDMIHFDALPRALRLFLVARFLEIRRVVVASPVRCCC